MPHPRRALDAAKTSQLQRVQDEDEDSEEISEPSSKMGLIIGAILALVIAGGGAMYLFVFKKSSSTTSKEPVEIAEKEKRDPAVGIPDDPFKKQGRNDFDPPPKDPGKTVKPNLPEVGPKKGPPTPGLNGDDLSKIAWSKVYLSEMVESESRSGPWPVTKNGKLGNLPPPQGPDPANLTFKVKDKPYPKGISMHPPDNSGPAIENYAFAKFRLANVGQRFKAQVAIADTGNPLNDVFFEVMGDGKRIWAQGLRATRQLLDIDVNVAGVEMLELRT